MVLWLAADCPLPFLNPLYAGTEQVLGSGENSRLPPIGQFRILTVGLDLGRNGG